MAGGLVRRDSAAGRVNDEAAVKVEAKAIGADPSLPRPFELAESADKVRWNGAK